MQSCAVSQAQAQEYAHLAKHLYKKKKKNEKESWFPSCFCVK